LTCKGQKKGQRDRLLVPEGQGERDRLLVPEGQGERDRGTGSWRNKGTGSLSPLLIG